MNRPPLEVADIIRAVGRSFIEKNRSWLTGLHRKVLSAIERCRTAALGGHKDQCSRCGYQAISYNSCLMGSNSLWGSTLCIGRKVAISCPFLSPLKRDSRESCQFVWRSNDLGLRCGGTTVLAGSDFLLRLPRVLISVVVKLSAE